jgi:hypothetical protein
MEKPIQSPRKLAGEVTRGEKKASTRKQGLFVV